MEIYKPNLEPVNLNDHVQHKSPICRREIMISSYDTNEYN